MAVTYKQVKRYAFGYETSYGLCKVYQTDNKWLCKLVYFIRKHIFREKVFGEQL